jgi:hypothetical protein
MRSKTEATCKRSRTGRSPPSNRVTSGSGTDAEARGAGNRRETGGEASAELGGTATAGRDNPTGQPGRRGEGTAGSYPPPGGET